jgi:SP family myo-inositol transporter-like MFS transporter 13
MTTDTKNEKTEFSDVKFESHISHEHVENISHTKEHADEIAALSGIEAEAASKAAWLIASTVSIGNLLFGTYSLTILTESRPSSHDVLWFAQH